MKRLLLAAAFLSLFVADIKETKAVDCSSPVWKNHSSCRDKETGSKKSTVRSSDDDLGVADILGPDSEGSGVFKAKCGAKAKKCNVSFIDGRLTINNGRGITKDQFVNVVTARTCRQRSIALPMVRSCFQSQYDHDYTITYRDKDGGKRAALIAFRPGYFLGGELAHKSFYRELQIWIGDVLRPIGPSIEIE